jgi:hypothetical protein
MKLARVKNTEEADVIIPKIEGTAGTVIDGVVTADRGSKI